MAITIKGVELKLDERDEQIISSALVEQIDRADAAEKKVAELSTAAGAAAVEVAALKSRCDAAEQRIAKLDRAELEQTARLALGDEKLDGKSDAEIKAAVVAKMFPGLRVDGADAAFIQGAYVSACALAQKAHADMVKAAEQSTPGARTDAADPNDPEKARAEMLERRRNQAFKG